jgi:hypothetical protein
MQSQRSEQSSGARPTSGGRVFRDLRARNERRAQVAKLLETQRRRRIERGMTAQLEHWARYRR